MWVHLRTNQQGPGRLKWGMGPGRMIVQSVAWVGWRHWEQSQKGGVCGMVCWGGVRQRGLEGCGSVNRRPESLGWIELGHVAQGPHGHWLWSDYNLGIATVPGIALPHAGAHPDGVRTVGRETGCPAFPSLLDMPSTVHAANIRENYCPSWSLHLSLSPLPAFSSSSVK